MTKDEEIAELVAEIDYLDTKNIHLQNVIDELDKIIEDYKNKQ
jgi:hypothetical protein